MKRRMIVSGSCGLGSFAALALSGAAFGDFIFFTDPGEFFAAIEAQGKVSSGFWDFKPNNVGEGFIGAICDPLNYLTAPGTGIWDNMPLDNIQFQSNLNPGGEGGPNPRGANGLRFATAPFFGIKNNVVLAGTFVDSFDILSGVPVGANHTAMALNVVSLASDGVPIHITVWDKNEENAQKLIIGPLGDSDKQFVGILATNDMTIGRVNIYDTGKPGGAEGISAIEVFVSQRGLIWFTNQAEFEAFNAGKGKVLKGIEDYEEAILFPFNLETFDDPLESGVANAPDGFPFPVGMTGLPNLIVQSNLGGGNPTVPDPRGPNALLAASLGTAGVASDVVLAGFDSLDLIFTDEKSGVGFNTVTIFGGPSVEVRVYSTTNVFLGMMGTPADPSGDNFIGVWSQDPIGRINIWDAGNGSAGADNIQAWGDSPCVWDLDNNGTVGATDLLSLLVNWGVCAPCIDCPADFDHNCTVGATDLLALLVNWGPCP